MSNVPIIQDLMRGCPIRFYPKENLHSALVRMRKQKVKDAPVVDNDRVIGVLSDRYLTYLLLLGDEFGLTVLDAMTPDPLVVDPREPADQVITKMVEKEKETVVIRSARGEIQGIFNGSDAHLLLISLLANQPQITLPRAEQFSEMSEMEDLEELTDDAVEGADVFLPMAKRYDKAKDQPRNML